MASELKASEPNVAGWRETVTDLTAGAAGGAAQVLIGQPFDLVKVRLQTQNGGNALSTARNIWAKEGPLAFYKGTLMPLLGVGACVSIQFGAFHGLRQVIESYNKDSRPGLDATLSLPQYYLADPTTWRSRIYNGPWDCALKLIRTAGIPGIYRGQAVTLLREIHGYGVWFAAYEGLVGIAMDRQQKKREELPSWQIAVCGGLAGEALWLLSHPLDVIKSKMQSDGFGAEKKYRNMRFAFRHTWVTGGLRGLFYGLGPALLRAMPVSAGTFATVEVVRKFLG
ncbi:hypothetical protein ABOM_010922 [Aspergillus bombycis]|uniref:Uncharacterized protein n=1 Tax=Aspergillus bombycis TaxID=109264 RepID=A0A1F7ZM10_9EURO|nr:hypothetical protein ABOM_010922 [Aspergillus bombycis]OGM40451.1 hypothetical protein ABOM_010922 [Aspergillus bombycis]